MNEAREVFSRRLNVLIAEGLIAAAETQSCGTENRMRATLSGHPDLKILEFTWRGRLGEPDSCKVVRRHHADEVFPEFLLGAFGFAQPDSTHSWSGIKWLCNHWMNHPPLTIRKIDHRRSFGIASSVFILNKIGASSDFVLVYDDGRNAATDTV
ncbi:MAG: hypothetical protein K8J08_02825 [Thermoanaerobaculia bacterium]|nr:hypothetical protein [Thermoanaerobaculia bacterium]